MTEITLGILSWGATKTLVNTLNSLATYKLDSYANEKIIFFQQISKIDINIAQEYGYQYLGAPVNLGIAGGYKKLLSAATKPLFLFLENDWELLSRPHEHLDEAKMLLDTNTIDVVRLRHRKQPGNPLWTRQFEGNELLRPTHLLDSVHWTDADRFDGIWRYKDWFCAFSKNANWTNNPTLAKVDFLKEHIAPHIGGSNIEADLQSWWEQQDFMVAQGEGLFTHNRIG